MTTRTPRRVETCETPGAPPAQTKRHDCTTWQTSRACMLDTVTSAGPVRCTCCCGAEGGGHAPAGSVGGWGCQMNQAAK